MNFNVKAFLFLIKLNKFAVRSAVEMVWKKLRLLILKGCQSLLISKNSSCYFWLEFTFTDFLLQQLSSIMIYKISAVFLTMTCYFWCVFLRDLVHLPEWTFDRKYI